MITPALALLESAFDNVDLEAQPASGAHALPASMYRDGPIVEIERSAVFARHWQYLGHCSQLSTDGDLLMASLGGLDVALTRSAQGIRGFHAVCRHRAGPLEPCRGGGKTFLRCRYHAWAYGLDGQLLSAPEMRGAEGFDTHSIRLPEIEVAEFEGLIFGRLEPGPASLEEALADVVPRLARAGHTLTALRFYERVSYDIDCHWKTYVDNYLEGYHVPHFHPTLNVILDYRSYTTTLSRWYSLQSSPLESTPDAYGSGEALYYFIYPNTMLNILPGRLQTNRVLPLRGNRCRVEFDFLYRDAPLANDRAFSDVVQQEDVRICEDVQRNLDSGSYVSGLLNPTRESGVHHFQELLRADYREALRRAKEIRRPA
ncbi:MAG: aromatic ring-hydroxylating oxygenase subunit alpha [Gammaproteobacteria bacterium]